MTSGELYNEYKKTMQQIADVKYAAAVLQWDQETYLPPKGNEMRGRQIATLSEIAHNQFTHEKLGNLLSELNEKNDLSAIEKKNVLLTTIDYQRNTKLNSRFVRQLSETVNRSYHDWIKARKKNSFKIFEKSLDELIQLKKQEADMLGYEMHPYNALMNDYDSGLTVKITDAVFSGLKPQLISILEEIKKQPVIDNTWMLQYYGKDDQWKFGLEILKRTGFDFEAGRQDISEHPFTTNFNSADVRITTRIDEHDFGNMTWSCLHEGGHALYEQGLPHDEYGLPSGEFCSLSIHESQSRLWENNIGRSFQFWQHNFPLLKSSFPQQTKHLSAEQFYKGINKIMPSLIRTEADELTYHLHVMIRYEIEKLLIEGSIKTKDIPAYWNEHYQQYLGVAVPDDKRGCLQDIHWSHGSFGYFATYSLGSLYAAQFYAAICKENESLEKELASGNNESVLKWLQRNIYQYGRLKNSEDLCYDATGENLNTDYFIRYIKNKYYKIYSV